MTAMYLLDKIKKRFRRWDRKLTISKRQQFVIATLMLTTGLVFTYVAPGEYRFILVGILALTSGVISAFVLRQDLKGAEWFTLLILPMLFTLAVGLFYFLLPVRWLTRLPVAVLYGVGMYALLLTENIYNVAAARTIALLRAAHSIGFLLTLITFFLLSQTIFAFRMYGFFNMFSIGVISYVLILQSLWSMELTTTISRQVHMMTVVCTFVLMQLTWLLGFWPVASTLSALLLTTCLYSLVGMSQQYVVERLYKRTVIEFFVVFLIVFAIVFATTRFRGGF